jgi:hypothetical protein
VIITTGRIRRTLVNKINLLVDSPRSIEASRLAPVKAISIFLRRASGCFGTSCDLSRDSSSTTSPRVGSLSTSPAPRARVPRHVARLVTRLVVAYFAYAARPGASACRAARHPARHRLLRLRRASVCLGRSRGSSLGSLSTTSPTPRVRLPRLVTRLIVDYFDSPRIQVPRRVARLVTRLVAPLVVDYFAYAARPGASAGRAARHAARRRLVRLRRASGCLGTSRGSSPGSSSTTSTTPRVQVPRHVARLVTRLVAPLVVDYFAYAARPGASARRAARHPARRRLLHLRRASACFSTSCGLSRDSSSITSPCAGSSSTTLTTPRVRVPRHVTRLITRLVAPLGSSRGSPSTTPCAATSSCGHTDSTSAATCIATTCLVATLALLRVRRVPP